MAILALLLVALGGVVLLAILRGFVLSYLWSWFVVPFGLFELSVAHAIGFSMLVAFLTYEQNGPALPKDEAISKLVGSVLVMPVVLLMGYIIQSFM